LRKPIRLAIVACVRCRTFLAVRARQRNNIPCFNDKNCESSAPACARQICKYCVCPLSIMASCCLRSCAQKLALRERYFHGGRVLLGLVISVTQNIALVCSSFDNKQNYLVTSYCFLSSTGGGQTLLEIPSPSSRCASPPPPITKLIPCYPTASTMVISDAGDSDGKAINLNAGTPFAYIKHDVNMNSVFCPTREENFSAGESVEVHPPIPIPGSPYFSQVAAILHIDQQSLRQRVLLSLFVDISDFRRNGHTSQAPI
jgi:hypothetical protein